MTANCTRGRFKGRGTKEGHPSAKRKGKGKGIQPIKGRQQKSRDGLHMERREKDSRDARGRGKLGKGTINNR